MTLHFILLLLRHFGRATFKGQSFLNSLFYGSLYASSNTEERKLVSFWSKRTLSFHDRALTTKKVVQYDRRE